MMKTVPAKLWSHKFPSGALATMPFALAIEKAALIRTITNVIARMAFQIFLWSATVAIFLHARKYEAAYSTIVSAATPNTS